MLQALIGQKIKQTRTFDAAGQSIPVTEIVVGPQAVVEVKSPPAYPYWAVTLGFGQGNTSKVSKPFKGYLAKTEYQGVPRFLQQVKLSDVKDTPDYKSGQLIEIGEVFKEGDLVKVTGISKSKGFQGGVKRHGFRGGPRTHGQSDRERAPGSIGQTTTPGRVYKGKRMAGRMGGVQVTVKGLKIIKVDPQTHTLVVKGLIPGAPKSLVTITKQ